MLPIAAVAPLTASCIRTAAAPPLYSYRRATSSPADICGIQRVASVVDMTASQSFMWSDAELIALIDTCDLIVVVVEDAEGCGIVGVAGMSIYKEWSRTPCRWTATLLWSAANPCVVPNHGAGPFAVCRGLLVDRSHEQRGLGCSLHAARVRILFEDGARYLILGARGVSLDCSQSLLSPLKPSETSDDVLISCTYRSSHGVVRIARRFGMEFLGVDVDDGGLVWGQHMTHGCWEWAPGTPSSTSSSMAAYSEPRSEAPVQRQPGRFVSFAFCCIAGMRRVHSRLSVPYFFQKVFVF